MRIITISILATMLTLSCADRKFLKNQTRSAGYAMGENVELKFATNRAANPPDSIAVFVLENKSKYQYSTWATLTGCYSVCLYSVIWDGRKIDGNWPAGGRYLVFAKLGEDIFSDTVQFGLAD